MPFGFEIEKKLKNSSARAGCLKTLHGDIKTPAFVVVGTKATVKALSPEEVKDLGAQVVLANTYHLYLQPGDEFVKKAGGIHKFMNWDGPIMTDSGGFQVFSLGTGFGKGISKLLKVGEEVQTEPEPAGAMARVGEDGVTFKSVIDGSEHFFTPEKSIKIQHNIDADIIFAFDECTSPAASYDYTRMAMERTHRWAERSLKAHKLFSNFRQGRTSAPARPKSRFSQLAEAGRRRELEKSRQALFGIVQGGKFKDLREESAMVIGAMDFDGYGLGGSYAKEDIEKAIGWVNKILPKDKPRHLLGIGEPEDIFAAVEQGVDLFDCVAPTRKARNGTLYTKTGRINILNSVIRHDLNPIDKDCGCESCKNYTRSYIAHLFHAKEMFGHRLTSIHNLYFIVNLVKKIRDSILKGDFFEYKKSFLKTYSNL